MIVLYTKEDHRQEYINKTKEDTGQPFEDHWVREEVTSIRFERTPSLDQSATYNYVKQIDGVIEQGSSYRHFISYQRILDALIGEIQGALSDPRRLSHTRASFIMAMERGRGIVQRWICLMVRTLQLNALECALGQGG
jgi:hypothetical protein